jgi:glutaminyl-peptide cyclotransferase
MVHPQPATPAAQRPRSTRLRLAGLGVVICGVAGVAALLAGGERGEVPVDGFEVVNTYPHDARAFCQGLAIDDGKLYEGTGQYGASSLREVELETGRVIRQFALDRQFFGEGITLMDDSIYQLTWRARQAFVFDRETLEYKGTLRYRGEGWGLTHDGTHLIMSDGTSTLRFLDPATFSEVRRVSVRDGRRRIDQLNELEYVEGEIYANIWKSDFIARISPADGRILGWIDLTALWPLRQRPDAEAVLNGIAWDAQQQRLFVTGKHWPRLYEIRVVPKVDR